MVGVSAVLDTISETLTSIYDRLEHVKVDSFVNVRVMDDLGALPIPSTELTGLLVSAYASGTPAPVAVVGTVPVTVDGTVPVTVTSPLVGGAVRVAGDVNATMYASRITDGAHQPIIGLPVTGVTLASTSGVNHVTAFADSLLLPSGVAVSDHEAGPTTEFDLVGGLADGTVYRQQVHSA